LIKVKILCSGLAAKAERLLRDLDIGAYWEKGQK